MHWLGADPSLLQLIKPRMNCETLVPAHAGKTSTVASFQQHGPLPFASAEAGYSSDDGSDMAGMAEPPTISTLEAQLLLLCTDIAAYAAEQPHVTGTAKLLRRAQREVSLGFVLPTRQHFQCPASPHQYKNVTQRQRMQFFARMASLAG